MSLVVDDQDVATSFPSASFREQPWASSPGQRPRGSWIRQYFFHKTIADDPEKSLGESGPSGGAKQTVDDWQSGICGADLITDFDGITYCLCDLKRTTVNVETASNDWSVGHEQKEQIGGGYYEITLQSAAQCCLFVCRRLGIQLQMPPLSSYTGHPIPRLSDSGSSPGGPDCVGIFGHRDNTERRGRWDPGDRIFQILAGLGVEQLDFAHGQDRDVWRSRQKQLGMDDAQCDGIAGPATVAALRTAGYLDGIWMLGRVS